jgi:hypothetical protein
MRGPSARVVTRVALVAATALLGFSTATGRAGTRTASVIQPPTITSFSPENGAVWRTVTITGQHFKRATHVKFGRNCTGFKIVSSTTITVQVPPGAVTAPISVTSPAGKATSATPFTVMPRIWGFSPTSGAVGTLVKLKGTTFNGTTAINFGSVAADMSSAVVHPSSITVYVPAGAVTGKIFVTTAAGTRHSYTDFKVTP